MEGAGRSAVDRRVDPPAVRAGRQPGDRRRREVRQHEVLLHPQADARQGVAGVRLPARRLRHARRDVRAAHPDADRQGPAGADHLPRHGGRLVLGIDRRADPRPAGHPQPGVGGRHPPVLRHRLVRRGVPRDRALLRQLRLDPLRRQPGGHPPAPSLRPTSSSPRSTSSSATSCRRGGSSAPNRWPSRSARPTTSTCRASASSSPSTSTATCGR